MLPRLYAISIGFLVFPALFAQTPPDVRTILINGRLITYEVQGGNAIVSGDIIIGSAEELTAAGNAGEDSGKMLRPRSVVSLFNDGSARLWLDATMYYEIDPALPNQQRVLDAIQYWNDHTPLKILPHVGQPNHVRFLPATLDAACASSIGMIGGEQRVPTTDICTTGNLIHEIGHAWGLLHEQARSDRNAYITVLYQNVDKRFYHDFDQIVAASKNVGYYDYDSIMHYGASGFTRNNLDSIETVPVGIPIGQRAVLSSSDIDSASRLYGFVPGTTTVTTIPAGLTMAVDGVESKSPQSYSWAPGSTHTVAVNMQTGTDPRYSFVRWSDGGEVNHTITASADQTVFAAIFRVEHKPGIGVASGNGSVTATPSSADGYYAERLPVRVTAIPVDASQFWGWSGVNPPAGIFGPSSPSPTIEVTLPNSQFLANFSTLPLTTVDSQPRGLLVRVDGRLYLTPINFPWNPGSNHTVALDVTQAAGNNTSRYRFKGWNDGNSDAERSISAGASSTSFVALFTPQWLLTTATAGRGTVTLSPSTPDGFYDDGTAVEVVATPAAGMSFRYWLGDLTGIQTSQTLTMNSQTMATAVFGPPIPFWIVNAASNLGNPISGYVAPLVAPLELVTIFGNNIGPDTPALGQADNAGRYATNIGGTRVLFDNTPAPILSAAQNQITVVVPSSITGPTSTVIRIEKNGANTLAFGFPVGETFPALLTLDGSGKGQVQATNPDGTPNGPSTPAPGGSIVTLYATGAGLLDQPVPDGEVTARDQAHPVAPIFVRVGKLPAEVVYAGTAPQMVNGILEVDIRLPAELVPGLDIPVQLIAGAYSSSPGTTIAVR